MPVGGVKEKLLAAHRAGMREVLIPEGNRRDLDDVPDDVKRDMTITLVSRVDEILPLVLEAPRSGAASIIPPPNSPPEDRHSAV